MRHTGKWAMICLYGVICLILSFFITSQATAQNKVVVVPLMGDKTTAPAPVEKTGHTNSIATGDDGDLQKGVVWPNPRFNENGNGTATDNLTGLIWLKNANCFGQMIWSDAVSACNDLTAGYCGLTDGSSAGDWRLPNVKELQSLLDFGNAGPALPDGHPFSSLRSAFYWSSTVVAGLTYLAWVVSPTYGHVDDEYRSNNAYTWPVRGGN